MATKTSLPKSFTQGQLLALLLATICGILISPKYMFYLLAWPGAALYLYFMRTAPLKAALLGGFLSAFISGMISYYQVMPLPGFVFVIFILVGSGINLIPYLLDRWVTARITGFGATLFFPCIKVTFEFLNSFGSAGVWSSVANTQFENSNLIQLASVTGIWGISFMIYWLAAVCGWVVQERFVLPKIKRGVLLYAGIFLAVILFGAARKAASFSAATPTVRIAGISVNNLGFIQEAYKGFSGKTIKLTNDLAPSSPEMQAVNQGFGAFIENPVAEKFTGATNALETTYDELFALSAREARAGAKIILWSEANAVVVKNQEPAFLQRGQAFARQHKIYLLMSLGVLRPGKITADRQWLENKTVFIGPDGTVLNTYFKSVPVPGVEAAVPGDGQIPAIKTPYGTLSPAICYDAEFPKLMQQTAAIGTDILLLPSGDWRAIAPFHSYMGVFRGIENGCSVVRQVSNGLSVAADPTGKIISAMNYFNTPVKVNVANVPTKRVPTVYARIGDAFAYLCVVGMFGLVLTAGRAHIKSRQANASKKTVNEDSKQPAMQET